MLKGISSTISIGIAENTSQEASDAWIKCHHLEQGMGMALLDAPGNWSCLKHTFFAKYF